MTFGEDFKRIVDKRATYSLEGMLEEDEDEEGKEDSSAPINLAKQSVFK